jgi:hypothetical protein
MKTQNAADKAAAEAANLLLRLGLLVAFVLTPVTLLVSQRSIFILTPIAGALTFASGLMLAPRMRLREIFAFIASPLGLAGIFLTFWAAASLLWTPFPAEAAPRLLKTLFTFLCVLPIAAALPARSKAANLYLLPLGVAMAAFGAIFLGARAKFDPDEPEASENMIRATEFMLLLLWPAIATTGQRQRLTLSAGLAIVVLAAAIAVRVPAALGATAFAALAFSAASADRRKTGRWIGALGAASFICAPAIPLLLGPLLGEDPWGPLASVKTWYGMILNDGPRMITGHGFNFVGSGWWRGYLPNRAPSSILFETWTDLGLIGALAGAALIYLAYRFAAKQSERLAPYCLGALTYVSAMGVLGGATVQLWWITALALTLAAFVLAARGDYKTLRPTAPRGAPDFRLS